MTAKLPKIMLPLDNSPKSACPLPVSAPFRKIALPTLEGIYFEKTAQLLSLEAQGNYTLLRFVGKRKLLVSKTLLEMEKVLADRHQFVRIHRSYTINLIHLHKYVRGKGGYVILDDGSSLSVSAGKRQDFLTALANYFG